jgi:DNA-binding NtrC family response regulator
VTPGGQAPDQRLTLRRASGKFAGQMLGDRRVVLLIEDDDTLREATTKQLKARGYAVIPLATARDAAEVLTFMRPAVIIVDYRLRDATATALLDAPNRGRAPIVMVSGFSEGEEAAADRGIPFVKKPFEFDALCEVFEPLMAS